MLHLILDEVKEGKVRGGRDILMAILKMQNLTQKLLG